MSRRPVAVALVVVLLAITVAVVLRSRAEDGAGFCAVVDQGLPSLTESDSAERWRGLESAAGDSIRSDVQVLRVVARQIERLGPDAGFEFVAARALRPDVTQAFGRVVAHTRAVCG
jgi:hypothetical protein